MSTPSGPDGVDDARPDYATPSLPVAVGGVVDTVVAVLAGYVRAVSFWSAVSLPFLQLALIAYGLSTVTQVLAFLVLLVANVVALLVGHPYRSPE